MRKILPQLLKNSFFPLLILATATILAIRNYEPGTFLSGWDSLHPEFNLALYAKRAFWGVWQQHQGVGAVASQAHAAELSRLPIVWLLSLLLPLNLVRYSFFFLTLGIGGVGVYYLAKYFLSIHSEHFSREASFLAGLFYMLNLATLQHFYVPLEMFAVHFASLPWLLFLGTAFLREGKNRLLAFFCLATILSGAMAHTPTLFYAFLGGFFVLIISIVAVVRRKALIKRAIILLSLTIGLNLYWLAPNLYFLANHSQDVTGSKIHRVFSDEAYLQSRAFGNIESLGILKNFLFNWREYDFSQNKFVDLMDEWEIHLAKPYVREIGYGLSAFALFGVFVALMRKAKYAASFLPVLIFCLFFLINSNPPFTAVFDFLREKFELFREGLRFPFTKFSILLLGTLSVYFAYSAQFLLDLFGKIKASLIVVILTVGVMVYFMLPAFEGKLISPSMKVAVPQEYFQVFNFFKTRSSSARVAKLPMNTFWGWNFYGWGYQGAGFSWFGIAQATFDREFDRWTQYNESFYNEASFALYNRDSVAFEQVLEKYGVNYLLLDESIVNAGGDNGVLAYETIREVLNASDHIKLEEQFGFLSIYRTDFSLGSDFLDTPTNFYLAANSQIYSDTFPVYSEFGSYLVNPRLSSDKVPSEIKPLIVEDLTKNRGFAEAVNCDLAKIGTVDRKITSSGVIYRAENGGVSCDFLDYRNLNYGDGYLIRILGENVQGRSLKIYLNNIATGRMDLEELLPKGVFDEYFVVLPKRLDGSGYILSLETRSYGALASENVLQGVEIYNLPLNVVSSLPFDTVNSSPVLNNLEIEKITKVGPSFYLVKTRGEGLLVLEQGLEKGWVAYEVSEIKNLKLKIKNLQHVRVDGWANGWFVNSSTIIIFFLPQILEFFGFLVAAICLYAVFKKAVLK
jgi:hypothetical protein